jgi:undecaprenyl-diphosphatase
MVIAAGGDGTVRACAQALAGTRVPVAIVPLGTANLAARALGVPSRTGDALAAGFGGQERRIDLAVAEMAGGAEIAGGGEVAGAMTFAAMAGIGLDAEVVGATRRLLKERIGWLAYGTAGIAHLPGRRARFTVRLDGGEPLARRARSVVVGNAGLLPGGFVLLPRARLDDGLLDVGILAPSGPAGWVRVAHRVMTGSSHDDQRLERHQARRIEIRAETELPREVDGEMIIPGRSLTVTLLRRALTVRVPPIGN